MPSASPPTRLRIGIVGLGFGERVLLPAFRAASCCEVVGVCAGNWEHARRVADRFEIAKAHRDWEALVDDPGVDAVVIATPPAHHCAVATAAFARNKHVFCEKPLADSVEAAEVMAEAAVEAGTAHMVDFEFPDMAVWREARNILASGTLGRLRHVRVSWFGETYANRLGLQSWKTSVAAGGGVLNDFVSHCFYYLEWLLGPIRRIWAAPTPEQERERHTDTVAVLCLELHDGTVASISVHTAAFLGDGHSITVHAEDGTLVLVNRRSDTAGRFELLTGTRQTGRLERILIDDPADEGGDYRIPAIGRLIDRFVDWAQARGPSRPNFEDGLRVQNLLDTAWRSRREGAWCAVAPLDVAAR